MEDERVAFGISTSLQCSCRLQRPCAASAALAPLASSTRREQHLDDLKSVASFVCLRIGLQRNVANQMRLAAHVAHGFCDTIELVPKLV